MAKAPGSPKTGGRQKGTPNKRTQEFTDILEERNFCPAIALIKTYRRAERHFLQFDRITDAIMEQLETFDAIDATQIRSWLSGIDKIDYLKIAEKAAADLMPYKFPRRKAIEHSIKDEGPLAEFLRMAPEERARRRAELAARLSPKKAKRAA